MQSSRQLLLGKQGSAAGRSGLSSSAQVAYREENGRFESLEDVQAVPGLGAGLR